MQLPFPEPSGPAPDAESERRALVGLSLVPGVGGARIRALVSRFGSPSAVWEASPSALMTVPGIGEHTADAILSFDDREAVDHQMTEAERAGAEMITPWDDGFPSRLLQIYDPPAFLWMRGRLLGSDERAIAVVGTRSCTDYGRSQARVLTQELVRRGFTIVSGLAYGIDAVAHRTALEEGGRTFAVLGSGLNRIYPQAHAQLARRISRHGAVLSELPLNGKPDASNFPERNRIVSGMCLGTLVVESREQGGALITARMACEQNREVFAVPGDAGRATSAGTNRLIQHGHAKLVLDADDIVEEIDGWAGAQADSAPGVQGSGTSQQSDRPGASAPDLGLEGPAGTLYEELSTAPVHLDTLCDATDLSPSTALAVLFEMELQGLVQQRAGKRFCRA